MLEKPNKNEVIWAVVKQSARKLTTSLMSAPAA